MPKVQPDHRQQLEVVLGRTERNYLKNQRWVIASQTVKNVGEGVGAVLSPVLNNLVAIAGFIIAAEGVDVVKGFINEAVASATEYYDSEEDFFQTKYDEYLAGLGPDEIPMSKEEHDEKMKETGYYKRASWWKRQRDGVWRGIDRVFSPSKW